MHKYGIVSTASIAKRVIEAIRLTGNEVVAIASRDLDKAKRFAEENNIEKYYDSYSELYKDKDIDIVYIPVINHLHYACAKEALENHKNVLLEKPFTLTEKEATQLFDIAEKNNCFLMEGVKNVFMPSTKFIKDNLNIIGNITSITSNQSTNNPFPKYHWMYKKEYGGGAYIGSCAYCYHLLMNIFDDFMEDPKVTFTPSHLSADKCVSFKYKISNIPVLSVIDMENVLDNLMVIYGEKGRIEINTFWRSHEVKIYLDNKLVKGFKDGGNEFIHEINHITYCLDNNLLTSDIITKERTILEVSLIEKEYGIN